MTDPTSTIPDDLIQNWPADLQNQLLATITDTLAKTPYLADAQPVQCADIVACGSRVLGCYGPGSDIDAAVYIQNYIPPEIPGRVYCRYQANTTFQGIVKMNVWLRAQDDINLGVFAGHPDAPTSAGWRMPHYSLITHTLNTLYPDEIADFLSFRHMLNPSWHAKTTRDWSKLIVDIPLPF